MIPIKSELNAFNGDIKQSIVDSQLFRKPSPEYLQELLQDKQKLQCFQRNFKFRHLLSILEKEINRVREKLFRVNGTSGQNNRSVEMNMPNPKGEYVTMQDKVYLPVEENPNFNFIGRILGPRGLTAKQLEQELQCKLMIRGKGSLRNKEKEEELLGKPNWEHLTDKLHINITVEDYENRAAHKLQIAKEAIEKFIEHGVKVPDGEDDIKKRQLMELAIINGTYRDTSKKNNNCNSMVTMVTSTGNQIFPIPTQQLHSNPADYSQFYSTNPAAGLLPSVPNSLGNSTALVSSTDFSANPNGCLFSVNHSLDNTNTALSHNSSASETTASSPIATATTTTHNSYHTNNNQQQHHHHQHPQTIIHNLYNHTNNDLTTNQNHLFTLLAANQNTQPMVSNLLTIPPTNQNLYNLPATDLTASNMAAAIASTNFIGPVRLRNISTSALRSHPYQLLGNI